MSLVQNSSPAHHHDTNSVGYASGGAANGKRNDGDNCMKQHLQHALMQYHQDQLSLPPKQINKQCTNRDTDSGRIQPASHSPTYFSSPYTNKQSSTDATVRLSHPEPIMSASNLSQSHPYHQQNTDSTSNAFIAEITPMTNVNTGASNNNHKSRLKVTTEKLPPIFSQISPRRSKKVNSEANKLWLGPPNSIPPNKRSEHIAAYKTIFRKSQNSARSNKSWVELQREHTKEKSAGKSNDQHESGTTSAQMSGGISSVRNDDEENDSFCSDYSDEDDGDDTFSEGNLSTFRSLRGIDTPMHHSSGRESNNSSVYMDRMSKREYTESNFGNYSTKVAMPSREHSYLDQLSVLSSTSIRNNKKSVHFAPDVREISRETRQQPLLSGSKLHSSPMGARLPTSTYSAGSTESVDQLPAVVEKFTIKSLPILPNIIPSAMNINANVIYIKEDGQMHSTNSSAISYSRRTASSRSFSSRSFSGSSSKQQFGYNRNLDIDDDEEECDNEMGETGESQATTKAKPAKKQVRIVLPSTTTSSQENYMKTGNSNISTSSSNQNHSSPTSSQPNSNRVTHKKTAANPTPKGKSLSTMKKAASQKTKSNSSGHTGGSNSNNKKAKKSKNNGSETSSRTSTNSSSPILVDPDDPEQRSKVYSQAMLAVQARMRELDTKFGSPQKIDVRAEDEYVFGKVVVPSASTKDIKPNKR